MQRLAGLVSLVFHPLYMPLLCVYLAAESDWYLRGTMYPEQSQLAYAVIGLSTIVFPGLNILLLKWYGAISDYGIYHRNERFVPFISSLFFFVLGYGLLRRIGLPMAIYSIMLGCIMSILVMTLFNLRIKLSAHAAGITGLLGCLLGLSKLHGWLDRPLLMAVILACGMVYTARLVLRAHSPREVYGGALVGFSVLYFSVSQSWII